MNKIKHQNYKIIRKEDNKLKRLRRKILTSVKLDQKVKKEFEKVKKWPKQSQKHPIHYSVQKAKELANKNQKQAMDLISDPAHLKVDMICLQKYLNKALNLLQNNKKIKDGLIRCMTSQLIIIKT